MTTPITLEELITVLETRQFKSSFKGRKEQPIFTFKDGFVGRNGIKFGTYKLTEDKSNFKISFSDTELGLFTYHYRNIVIIVKGDKRFPISLAFNSGSDDIVMEANHIS